MSYLDTYYDPNATPRDRALAAIALARDESDPVRAGLWLDSAVELAAQAGIEHPRDYELDALESLLLQIKYTVFELEIPTEAVERLLALPAWIREGLGIVGIRLPKNKE